MSIYDKPVSALTTADLQELLDDGAVENVRLEFKSEPPRRDELLKKLSSFANTYGGYLIVGAAEGGAADRLSAIPGVDPQPGYRQAIIQRCAEGIAPLIQPFVSDPIPAPGAEGKVCYVVYVPESPSAPHFLNGRRGAYVRIGEHSRRFEPQLATDVELRHLFDRCRLAVEQRTALVQRAVERFQRFERAEYEAHRTGARADRMPIGETALLHLTVVPSYPTAPLFEAARLREIVSSVHVSGTHGFPRGLNTVSQHESLLVLHPSAADFSLLEVNTWGLVGYSEVASRVWTPRGGGGQYGGISLNALVGTTFAVLEYARRVYDRLGYDGTVTLRAALNRIHRITLWAAPDGYHQQAGQSRFDRDVAFDLVVSTERFRTARDEVAVELLSTLLFALGLDDASTGALSSTFIQSAYTYNGWGLPA